MSPSEPRLIIFSYITVIMSLLAVALLYYSSKSDLGNINYVPDMSKCLGYCNYMYLLCNYIVIICNYM